MGRLELKSPDPKRRNANFSEIEFFAIVRVLDQGAPFAKKKSPFFSRIQITTAGLRLGLPVARAAPCACGETAD